MKAKAKGKGKGRFGGEMDCRAVEDVWFLFFSFLFPACGRRIRTTIVDEDHGRGTLGPTLPMEAKGASRRVSLRGRWKWAFSVSSAPFHPY